MAENQEIDLSGLKQLARLGIVKEFPFKQIKIDENNKIYEGENSQIYKSWLYGQLVTIKVLESKEKIIKSTEGLKNHAKLNHPNILILHGYCYHQNKLYSVSPFQSKNSLESCIDEINQIQDTQEKEKLILDILIDIAKGIQYLHSNQIIHRDLKPQNILLDNNFNAKICDFDFSIKFGLKSDQRVGTENYQAPESYLNPPQISEKNDIYSFGKIANFLIQNIKKDNKVEEVQGNKNFLQSYISLLILEGCIDQEPNQRPSIDQLLDKLIKLKRKIFGVGYIIPQQRNRKKQDTSNKLHNFLYNYISFSFILQFILIMVNL